MPANLTYYVFLVIWKILKFHHVTPGKCILAIILKDQSTLNNWCFTKYGKLCSVVIIRTPKNIKLYFYSTSGCLRGIHI